MWETVRDMTLKSTAPTLVYEEGSLIKRSIRDLYNKEIDEIHGRRRSRLPGSPRLHEDADALERAGGEAISRRPAAVLADGHREPARRDVLADRAAASGGYIVINQTEALVSIDVNSGRSTREHHIEDTALKTNLEAAEEDRPAIAPARSRGLIVIDFIDMDEKRNNRTVERRSPTA